MSTGLTILIDCVPKITRENYFCLLLKTKDREEHTQGRGGMQVERRRELGDEKLISSTPGNITSLECSGAARTREKQVAPNSGNT